MKNVKVSLEDEVYHRVRARAAELNTSVSALVKKYLIELTSRTAASDRLTRDQVHERRA